MNGDGGSVGVRAEHRVRALDGLRGVAVLLVVASHLSAYRADLLGPVGVSIFFVLSGFLITSLLLSEHDCWGSISLTKFYVRRALRLYPAMLLLVLVSPALLWTIGDPRIAMVERDATTTLLYVQDLVVASRPIGQSSPFAHCWSLAVEEQFYLVWPFALTLVLARASGDRSRVARVVFWTCIVSVCWHLVANLFASHAWIDYAPDTNAMFLLAGCAIATHQRARLDKPPAIFSESIVAATLAFACASALLLTPLTWSGEHRWRLQMLLMLPAMLAGVVLVPGARYLRLLENAVLRWFGKISYGLYLWNSALVMLEPHGRVLTALQRVGAALLSVGISAASWYLVEARVLRNKARFQRVGYSGAALTGRAAQRG